MNEVLGSILPQALGVAISPIPIIAIVVLLLSPTAGPARTGFVLGWALGVLATVSIVSAISSTVTSSTSAPTSPIVAILQMLFGALLIVLAARQLPHTHPDTQPQEPPKWLSKVDTLQLPAALGIGVALIALNPKNLLMSATAGSQIGTAALSPLASVLVVVIFTIIATSTVVAPVVAYRLAAPQVRPLLDRVRAWLTAHGDVVLAVLMLTVGVTTIGKGLSNI